MRFQILGPVRVVVDGREVTITRGRDRVLLGVLLLHANRPVTNDQLIDAVWPDRPPRDARNQLQGCVSRLRKGLAAAGLGKVIVTEPAGYRLVVEPGDLDLLEFRRLVAEARTAAGEGRYEDAATDYRAALALWRGPALAGVDGHDLVRAAASLDEERLHALEQGVAAELAAGGGSELVAELTELVGQHPLREGLHRSLMLALYRAGRQADALAAYQRARELLLEELGAEPGAELRGLHQAILKGDPLDGPLAAPPRRVTPTPRQLPSDVAGFSGRAEALKALDELLARRPEATGPVVISAIAGTAGVGKTALAVHWAHRVADRFPDGQLYVNLRGFDPGGTPLEPASAVRAFLDALAVPPEQIPKQLDAQISLYRSLVADRQMLIVLDNARDPEQVRPLLPGAPGCLVLVTSRNQLSGLIATDGAVPLSIDVLRDEEARQLLAARLGADRVAAEPEAVTELIAACAGLPLALTIVAARATARPRFPLAAVAAEVREVGAGLEPWTGPDAASDLRAVFSWSYQTLAPPAARLFRLLGLHPGPDFAAPVAASLAAVPLPQARRHLAQLTEANLIFENPPGRYSLHDLLRTYASELTQDVNPPDEGDARNRLLHYYLCQADAAARQAYGHILRLPMPPATSDEPPSEFDDRQSALAWLDTERSNVVAVTINASSQGPRQYAWLLADRLRGYFWHNRHIPDWLLVAGAALTSARHAGDGQAEAAARINLADAYVVSDRLDEAIALYEHAVDLSRRTDWSIGELIALNNLGLPYIALGRLADAAELYQRVLGLEGRRGEPLARSRHLQNLASAEAELGRLDDAYAHYTEALTLHGDAGHSTADFSALAELALLYCARGDVPEALRLATAATSFAAETGNPHDQLLAGNALGVATRENGEPGLAIELHEQAYRTAVRANDLSRQAETLRYLADAHQRVGDLERASGTAAKALALVRKTGAVLLEGPTLSTLAEVYCRQGKYVLAEQHAQEALARQRQTGQRLGEARTLAILSLVHQGTGRRPEAERYRRLATEQYAEIGAVFPAALDSATI